MKKQLRIPTLIALLFLIVVLVAVSFATNFVQQILTRADTSTISEVKKSNISDKAVTVSWISDTAVSGAVAYREGTGAYNSPILDDRVQAGSSDDKFYTHHVTVSFLKPATEYNFKIISGSKSFEDPNYKVTTAPNINSVSQLPSPIYGSVVNADETPASGVLVYVTVNNSSLLSTLTKSKGNWIIPLSTARTEDLKSFVSVNPKGDPEKIFIQGAKAGVSSVECVTGNDTPVPNITLGKSFDFSKVTAVVTVAPTNTPAPVPQTGSGNNENTSGFVPGAVVSPTPAILLPNNNGTIKDSLPTFSGTGLPGEVVQIIIHSDQNLVGSAVVDSNGRWSWTPSQQLDAGEHTVTIATADSGGQTKNITQKFIVLASGSGVTESATPSATLAPTATPTLTPTPTLIATQSAMPKTGNETATVALFVIGLMTVVLGFKMINLAKNDVT